jgi:hypothetical protein
MLMHGTNMKTVENSLQYCGMERVFCKRRKRKLVQLFCGSVLCRVIEVTQPRLKNKLKIKKYLIVFKNLWRLHLECWMLSTFRHGTL